MSFLDEIQLQMIVDGQSVPIERATSFELPAKDYSHSIPKVTEPISLSFKVPANEDLWDTLNYVIDKQEQQKAIQTYSIRSFIEKVKSQVYSLYYKRET